MDAAPHGHTLLVVDNDNLYRRSLISHLTHLGFDVQGVGDTAHVMRLLGRLHPCAILIDVRPLGEDGWALARDLHLDPATTHVPVLIVSGDVEDASRAMRIGARQFLSKPVDALEIASIVGGFCPKGQRGHPHLGIAQ